MRFFLCLLHSRVGATTEVDRQRYVRFARRRRLTYQWEFVGQLGVLTGWDDPYGDPLVATYGANTAVGVVRLDNRPDLERWAGCSEPHLTDLDLVLRTVARHGTRYVARFLGDFAFLVWDDAAQRAVAACDAFAVRRLYYSKRNGVVAFASRAEALAQNECYDEQYLLELLARHQPSPGLSVYAGVYPVPAASMVVLERDTPRITQYWSTAELEVEHGWVDSERQVADYCRGLLADSIRLRVRDSGRTWAQLSGGLDSSSIVCLAQWLAERGAIPTGLAGTVTFVDRQDTGADERAFSNAVLARWQVRNELILDPPTWLEDQDGQLLTDQPTFDLQAYPRERRVCAAVQSAGGRVLLTGWGGDELFMGNMLFFADWLAQGRVWAVVREIANRAATGRVSFWEIAYKNGLFPLLPFRIQRWLAFDDPWAPPVQPWLNPAKLRRYGFSDRANLVSEYNGPLRKKYHHAVATKIASLPAVTERGILEDSLELRHPFLYRPLVEFAVRLPPDLRARPHAHRWILREAMRDILPDKVRTRIGKQDTGELLAWCLANQQAQLAGLLREPILADLGIVNAASLRSALEAAPQLTGRGNYLHAALLSTLSVEAWLQMRSGRWPRGSGFDKRTRECS